MRTLLKIIFSLFLLLSCFFVKAQAPANDNCPTAEFINLSESGNACLNATNINATSDGVFNACDVGAVIPLPAGGHEIWYTYLAVGIVNSINITPIGATAAQKVSITVTNGNCAIGGTTICNTAVNPGDPASVVFTQTPGTQVWFYVTSLIADGDFLVCVNSVAGPINPGASCGTAARLCNKLDFSSPGTGTSNFAPTPTCFNSPPVRPMWYKFTVGNSGPLEFAGFPTGFGGFRWAMYDVTAGCPGLEVACNNFYDPFQPFGFSSSAINCTTNPFCAPVNVTAGSTYALMVDDTTQSNSGFDFNWSTNIKLLPTADFVVDSLIGCGSLTVDFTDQSIYNVVTAYFLDFGDGSPIYAGNGSNLILPSHTYNPGTYLIKLTLNQPGACNNTFARQVIVYPKPTSTFTTTDDSLCLPNGLSVTTDFKSVYSSSTANYNWTFANNNSSVVNSPGFNTVGWNSTGNKIISLSISENGCASDTSRDTVYVFNIPTSKFTLKDSLCSNDITTIQYTGNALISANYNWNYGGANISNVTNQLFDASWNLPGKKYMDLIVSENGCTSSTYKDSIIISQTPSVTINSFTRVCQGDTLTFTPLANGSTSLNYTWDFGTSTFISGNASDASVGVLTWNTPGLTYWTVQAISPTGCKSNKDSISFTVYPKPVSTFLLSMDKICGNGTSILSFTGSASASANYNFGNGGSLVTGALPNPLTLTFPGGPTTYPLYLSIMDNLCKSDTSRDTIFVYPLPIADAGIDTALCSGGIINIGSPTISGQTYSWLPTNFITGTTISDPQVSILNYGISDSIATYIVTANSGICTIKDTIHITVHPQQFAFFSPPIRQCFTGNSFNFLPSSILVNGAQYDWSFGLNATPDSAHNAQASNIHFNTNGWQQISLTTKSKGCAFKTYLDSVYIKTNPTVAIDASVFSGCPPLTVSFNNLSPIYPNSTLEWNFDDGNSSSQNNPTNIYLTAGSYLPTLTIITQDTCSTTDTINTSIEISAIPVGSFVASPPIVYDSYPIINFINNEPNISCHYDFGDGSTDTLCNLFHSYKDTGQYIVTLITKNINGCADTSKQIVNVKSLYTLFIPNAFTPNDDGLNDNLIFSNNGMIDFEITIYNRFGQVVFTMKNSNGSWDGNYFDTNTKCPDGVYVYSVKSTDVSKKKHTVSGSITLMR